MAKKLQFRIVLLILFFITNILFISLAQSTSFFDTLYKAYEDGINQSTSITQEVEESYKQSVPQEEKSVHEKYKYKDSKYQYQWPSKLTQEQLEEIIRQIIQQVINSSAGCGTRIVIVRIPRTGSGVGGSCPGTTVRPPTQSTPTNQPTQPTQPGSSSYGSAGVTGDSNEIAGLKAEMKAKFGIEAAAGIGADWSKRQLEEAIKVLETLPPKFRNCTKKIQRDARGIPGMPPGVLGWVQPGIPTVHLLNAACYQGTFQGTLVHEMAHCFQAVYPNIQREFERKFWPNGRWAGPISSSVSAYGNTQPFEDFAESCRMYWQAGKIMKQRFPDRYQFLKQYVFDGVEY